MAQPLFDAYAGNKVAAGTTNTWNHTVAVQNNRFLYVVVDAGQTVTGVTYNGVSMTQVPNSPINYNANNEHLSFWSLVNPPTGTNSVVATCGSSTFIVGESISYYGVNQTTPLGTLATNSGAAATSSTNTVTTTNTNQLVLDAVNNGAASTDTAGSSQTKRGQVATSGTAEGDIAATGSNMTLTWTFTSGVWAQGSVPLNAASSGNHVYGDGMSGIFP